MTVDLKLHRAIVTSKSIAARLNQLATRAPDQDASDLLWEGARVLEDTARDLEQRLQDVLQKEPGYPLAEKAPR